MRAGSYQPIERSAAQGCEGQLLLLFDINGLKQFEIERRFRG